MVGPPSNGSRTTAALLRQGFTPAETMHLLRLKHRYEDGAFVDTLPLGRLRFARWLVRNGRLSEGQVTPGARSELDGGRPIPDPAPVGSPEEPDGVAVEPRRTIMVQTGDDTVRLPDLALRGEPARPVVPAAGTPVVAPGRRSGVAIEATILLLGLLGVIGAYSLLAAFGV